MPVYIALLRAVNVGGTGKLPMRELKSMCEGLGFESVKTYIASGNVIFKSANSLSIIKSALEQKLEEYAGKPVGVMVRSPANMKSVLDANPFPDAEPSKATVLFLDRKAKKADITDVSGVKNEELSIGVKELYVHYPDGMGTTKLKIPAAKSGTARNINTLRKLILMADGIMGSYYSDPILLLTKTSYKRLLLPAALLQLYCALPWNFSYQTAQIAQVESCCSRITNQHYTKNHHLASLHSTDDQPAHCQRMTNLHSSR